ACSQRVAHVEVWRLKTVPGLLPARGDPRFEKIVAALRLLRRICAGRANGNYADHPAASKASLTRRRFDSSAASTFAPYRTQFVRVPFPLTDIAWSVRKWELVAVSRRETRALHSEAATDAGKQVCPQISFHSGDFDKQERGLESRRSSQGAVQNFP